MIMRDLIPWGRERNPVPSLYGNEQASPFLTLHCEMNRLFDETFRDFGAPSLFGRMPAWPSVEVTETDKDMRVAAELPGLEGKDVEVLMEDGLLRSAVRRSRKWTTKNGNSASAITAASSVVFRSASRWRRRRSAPISRTVS